jgi:hypothetical protein
MSPFPACPHPVPPLSPSRPCLLLQVFDATNWHVPQLITVAAIDDVLVEPQNMQALLTASVLQSTDTNYEALIDASDAWAAAATVVSDDVGHVAVRPTASDGSLGVGSDTLAPTVVVEGEGALLWVRLLTQPHGVVAAQLSVAGAAGADQVAFSPAVVKFSAGSWDTWHSVLVSAVEDSYAEVALQNVTVAVEIVAVGTLDAVYTTVEPTGDAATVR